MMAGAQTTTGNALSDSSHRFSQVASSGLSHLPPPLSRALTPPTNPRGRRRTTYALLSKKACGVGRWPWPPITHAAACRLPGGGGAAKKALFFFVCAGVLAWHWTYVLRVLCGASWGCIVCIVSYRYCIAHCERRGPRPARGDRSDPAIVRLLFFHFLFVYF